MKQHPGGSDSAQAFVEWAVSPHTIDYRDAVAGMEARAARIAAGKAPELIWLLEHPPIYTAGTGARPAASASERMSLIQNAVRGDTSARRSDVRRSATQVGDAQSPPRANAA